LNLNLTTKFFFTDLLDFFLPRFCPACKQKLSGVENTICNKCISVIHLADRSRIDYEFSKKFKSKKLVLGFSSLYVFEKDKELQEILHHFKYNKRYRIGILFGKEIAKLRKQIISEWNIDLILPVPLHHLKKAERGYNQSFYIAKGLSKILRIPTKDNILKRKRYTESQTLKNISDRESNVRDAFSVVSKNSVRGKTILLVDDVITTGATISECAGQLLNNGAAKVFAVSIAIAD
jgi:ComF family protein